MNRLTVDVYMDTVCPWCRMGTASLMTALEQLPAGTEATVRWHAYQLNPGIRPEGEDYRQVMIGKLGGEAQFEARMKQYNEYGARFGLIYKMDLVKYAPNTALSHQLIAITPARLQRPLIEKLYTAYFEQGIDIGNADELAKLGVAAGVAEDAGELKERFAAGEGLKKVEEGARSAQKLGIRGVPYFVVNEQVSLSGLRTPEEFIRVFEDLK